MDIFERKEAVKFTQLLRVKLRSQRTGQPVAEAKLDTKEMYERVQRNIGDELGSLRRRNEAIRRSLEVEKAGILVNCTLFDEEAEIFRHMRLSKEERFGRLRAEMWALCQKHLDKPPQLADDYVLARVYKHCCIIFDFESLVGNKALENEFYKFKEMFDTRARHDEVRNGFKGVVHQVYHLKDRIMQSQQQQDKLEAQGFCYNEGTFDDLFVKKFRDVVNVSTESSEDERDFGDVGGANDQDENDDGAAAAK